MKELISLCVRRPVTVFMAMAALGIAAVFSVIRMPVERLPELSVPQILVETVYNGMTAADIRSLVTIPVEDALSGVKGLQRVRSISRDNISLVSLDFRWGSDVMTASALVREAIDAVYPGLPDGISKPVVSLQNSGTEVHAIAVVRSLNGDNRFARHIAEYELRARLRRIDGVGFVVLAGGETGEQHMRLDMPRLAARGMNAPDFVRLVNSETTDIPAGSAREGNRELVVVSSGRPGSVEELSRLLVPAPSGAFIFSEAGHMDLESTRRKSVFVVDGKEAVALEIFRRPGADPVRLSREINQTIKETMSLFSHDTDIFVVYDASSSLVSGIAALGISAGLGAAAVIITLLIFIKQIQYSLLAALSIPVSVAAGICVLALSGKTLNSMSLGGLALSIGLVSDISVITLDLLHRTFGGNHESPSAEKIGSCTASISASSVASTVTTAVVFVPVIFLPGPLGSLFGDMAIALVSSITAGWLYAQFGLSSLFKFFFKNNAGSNTKNNDAITAWMNKKYRFLLAPFIRRPRRIIIAAVLFSVIGLLLLLSRPAIFVSPDEAKEIIVSLDFPPGSVLETAADTACNVSRKLRDITGIYSIYGRAGAEDEDINRRSDIDYRKEEFILHCRLEKRADPKTVMTAIYETIDGLRLDIDIKVNPPKDRIETLLGLSSQWSFAVHGKDQDEVSARKSIVINRLEEFSGGSFPVVSRPQGVRPELRLYPNREAAAYMGITGADIAETLYTMNEGIIAATLEIDGRPLDVRISGNLPGGNSPELLLENTPYISREGKTIYLGSLGRIERLDTEAAFARLDRNDIVYLDIQASNLKNLLNTLCKDFPWFSRVDESAFDIYRNSLLINIGLVLVLLYMTMGAQFESFFLPLVLMLSIPFSLAGTGPAMLIGRINLDSGAVLGLITLFGLVINNGLILYEICDQRVKMGLSFAWAVYGGTAERLRPVLITSLTTIMALVPLLLSPLANSQKSMAAAMMGGLIASTVLCLFILPPVFLRFFKWRENQ
jgi:multidrug efflux pump subunit AcrB